MLTLALYRYTVKNPRKYAGDLRNVIARSSWELAYMGALDRSSFVAQWVSEPKYLNIRYLNPIDNKVHSYWPDFIVKYIDGNLDIIEIKPLKEALNEKAVSQYDKLALIKNAAKWRAASAFAKSIGARFRVLTEADLFKKQTTARPKPSKGSRGSRK